MSGWMRPGPGDGVVIIVLISEGWVQASRDKAAHHLDRRTHSEPPRHCPGYVGVQPHQQIFYFDISFLLEYQFALVQIGELGVGGPIYL